MTLGTKDEPWQLTTAPGTSSDTKYRDGETLHCQVGSTKLSDQARAIDDLHAWLVAQGDWVPLGAADENKPAAPGTVEAFGRDEANPVGASTGSARATEDGSACTWPRCWSCWGLVELTHEARNNSVRAISR